MLCLQQSHNFLVRFYTQTLFRLQTGLDNMLKLSGFSVYVLNTVNLTTCSTCTAYSYNILFTKKDYLYEFVSSLNFENMVTRKKTTNNLSFCFNTFSVNFACIFPHSDVSHFLTPNMIIF